MRLTSTAFADGGRIPGDLAFCVIDPAAHVKLSENMNPDLRWSDVPSGTKSLALICRDPDVSASRRVLPLDDLRSACGHRADRAGRVLACSHAPR